MNFLPIVTRELRVASRRKGTYWIRWCAAGLATLVTLLLLAFLELANPATGGQHLFATLTYYTFGLCLLSGVFLTADCLSEEKREGTMGLFFLTDLKGYDVVLGKLLATSLNSFYGLLALMPILALPLLVGGVTGSEFWRTAVALLNAMFFSLVVGVWISARSNEAQKAMIGCLCCLGMFVIGFPLIRELFVWMNLDAAASFAVANPFSALQYASETKYRGAPGNYFVALAGSQFIAWMLVALASVTLPRSWQVGEKRSRDIAHKTWQFLSASRDAVGRKQLLERNPILWLMSASRPFSITIWCLAIAATAILILAAVFGGAPAAMFGNWMAWPVLLLIKLLVAFRATLFFSEIRRSGALELLVSTPLTNQEILHGQQSALRRLFFWPVVVVSIGLLAPVGWASLVEADISTWGFMGMMAVYGAVRFVVNIIAIVWFGMWMAMTCKKPAMATAWTVLFAIFLPAIAFCIPSIIVDVALILWARNRLAVDFRKLSIVPAN